MQGTDDKLPQLNVDRAFAYVVLRSSRLLRAHFHAMTAALGIELSPEQWLVLNRLTHENNLLQTELIDATFRDSPNVSRMLGSLERKGLICRQADKSDRRRWRVSLTRKGRQLHDRLIPSVQRERQAIYAGLSDADFDTLRRILDTIDRRVIEKLEAGF